MSQSIKLIISLCVAGYLIVTVAYGLQGNYNYRDVEPDNDQMLQVLNNAIYQYNGRDHRGRTHHMRLGNIRRARGHSHGEGGMRYAIDFDFMHTNCRRGNSYISREEFDRCEYDRSRVSC